LPVKLTVRASGDKDETDNVVTKTVEVLRAGSIAGAVMHDVNRNDYFDDADKRLAGATVTLLDPATGKAVAPAVTTKADGRYRFAHLLDGAYRVQVAPPAGSWTFIKPSVHGGGSHVTPAADGKTASVDVTIAGDYDKAINAGLATTPAGSPTPKPEPSTGTPTPKPPTLPGGGTGPTPTKSGAPPVSLPVTGGSLVAPIAAGVALILLGGAAMVVTRRRRRQAA
jgi:LPXTG-motif cell wall-anchored protein